MKAIYRNKLKVLWKHVGCWNLHDCNKTIQTLLISNYTVFLGFILFSFGWFIFKKIYKNILKVNPYILMYKIGKCFRTIYNTTFVLLYSYRTFSASVRILFKWSGPVSVCPDSKIYNVAIQARMCATRRVRFGGQDEKDEIAGKKSGYKCLGGAIWLWAKPTRNGFGVAKWNRWNGYVVRGSGVVGGKGYGTRVRKLYCFCVN